FLS
ncbi:hypothetical protein HID58_047628, partial [Brassica napus]